MMGPSDGWWWTAASVKSRLVDASGVCRALSRTRTGWETRSVDLLAVTSTDALNLLLWVNAPLTTCSEIGF